MKPLCSPSLASLVLVLTLFFLPCGAAAQSLQAEPGASAIKELKNQLDWYGTIEAMPLPDPVTIPTNPALWPGMNRQEVLTGLKVLAQARVVVLLSPSGLRQPIWIRSLRGYKKSNGWYGIRLNGQEIDEQWLYLGYGGREISFQELMTMGSRVFTKNAPFLTQP